LAKLQKPPAGRELVVLFVAIRAMPAMRAANCWSLLGCLSLHIAEMGIELGEEIGRSFRDVRTRAEDRYRARLMDGA